MLSPPFGLSMTTACGILLGDMGMTKKRVVVAMSGGVDSSVAACLLKEEGYDVVGITMRLFTVERDDLPPLHKGCCTIDDVEDARRVCQILDIPHYILNFEQDFKASVIDYFVAEYRRGRTPNPCIACNQRVKFAPLMNKALTLGADYLATGHYARVDFSEGRFRLLKAVDPSKDQSYVLYGVGQRELSRLLFPVGQYAKSEIRRIARGNSLPVAEKADSQEICFIPEGGYRRFISDCITASAGEVVDIEGHALGTHPGIEFFTIGQRHGLGISGKEPAYVISLDAQRNRVVVGRREHLFSRSLVAGEVNYISGHVPEAPLRIMARIRYKSPEVPATLYPCMEEAILGFDEPQQAITPGQAVLFYYGEEVLGGGVIEKVGAPSTREEKAEVVPSALD